MSMKHAMRLWRLGFVVVGAYLLRWITWSEALGVVLLLAAFFIHAVDVVMNETGVDT